MVGYLDVMRALVLTWPKISRCVESFKEKNNILTSFCIDDKLLENYKAICTNIEDSKKYIFNWVYYQFMIIDI